MILFINPLNSFLTQSKVTARLVYWGVQLIPTPESNKSLQVSGLYYGRLLSFIKYYIDEAIVEMETSETTPHTEEIESPYSSETEIALLNEAVDKKAIQSEPQTNSSFQSKIETDGVESVETESTPQKPEIVNAEIVETEEDDDDWPIPDAKPIPNSSSELSTDDAIAALLECQTKLQLMAKKKDIGQELTPKAWDEMTLVQKNYLQLISLRDNVTQPMGTLGYQLVYQPTKDSHPRKVRLIGFYLYGEKLRNDYDRAILIDGQTEPTICIKSELHPLKSSTPPTEAEIKQLEKLLTESQETEPTAETMAANTFTGFATAPKLSTGSETGKQLDSEPSKPSVVETIINHLKLIDNKFSCITEGDIINVNLNEQEIGYIDCSDFSVATILDEKLRLDYFFDICSYLGDVEAGEVEHLVDYYIVGHAPKQPESTVSEPSLAVQAGDITEPAIQLELPEPEYIPGGTIAIGTVYDNPEEIEATTPLLEAVKTELIKINNTLEYKTCKYDPKGSTFLEIYHGDSHLGFFEDDGDCLWDSVKKLKFHGFTEEQLDVISEIELPKA